MINPDVIVLFASTQVILPIPCSVEPELLASPSSPELRASTSEFNFFASTNPLRLLPASPTPEA